MKRPHALLLILLLALWALAWGMRLRGLPAATVGSDSLGQFLAALGLLRGGGLPHPPNPEGGHSLWLMVLPLLPLADSLQGLLRLRFALGALVAPLCGLAAWLLAEARGRFPAALAAGVVVALDPGLIDTLIVAFRGYGAPELLALATVGGALALRGRRGGLALAGLSLLAATGQHPFAAGAGLGALLCAPLLGPSLSTTERRLTLALGLLFLLPRLHHLAWLADCGPGAWACWARVASGSAEAETPLREMLRRAANDRILVEGWLPWPALALGLLLLLPRQDAPGRGLRRWALGSLLGVLALGLLAHSLRPYHLRLAMPALAVAAAVGLSRFPLLPLVWVGLCGVDWLPRQPLLPAAPPAAEADALARKLALLPGPVWVDAVYFGHPVGLESAPVVLAAVLQGQDPDGLRMAENGGLVLIVNGYEACRGPLSPLDSGQGWVALSFADRQAARAWLATQPPPTAIGGAMDWSGRLHPDAPPIPPW